MDNDNKIKQQYKEFYTNIEKTLQRGVVDLPQDSREFCEATEKYRYSHYPYFKDLMEFDKYNGKRVLEVGVGEGVDHLQFIKNGAKLFGLDLTPRHVFMTKKRLELYGFRSNLLISDAENLPFQNDMFDLVYACGVLFLLPNVERAVDEIYRVLKPGGKVIALFYNKNSFQYYANIILYNGIIKGELQYLTFNKLKDWYAGDGFGYPPLKYFNKRQLQNLFRKFNARKFYIATLGKGELPLISKFFTKGMLSFFSQYLGYYVTIKAFK